MDDVIRRVASLAVPLMPSKSFDKARIAVVGLRRSSSYGILLGLMDDQVDAFRSHLLPVA